MKKRRVGLKVAVIVVIILVIFFSLIGFLTNLLWFQQLGYISVFFKKLFTQLEIGIPTFIVITFLSYIYLKFLKRGYFKKIASADHEKPKYLNLITWGMAVVFGFFTTMVAISSLWFEVLKFANSTGFNLKDPLYHLDISFYIFKLPFIRGLDHIAIGVIIAFAVLTLLYYAVLLAVRTPQIFEEKTESDESGDEEARPGNFDNVTGIFEKIAEAITGKSYERAPRKNRQFDNTNLTRLLSIAEKQLVVMGLLFFIMLGVYFFLKQYDLLYGHTPSVYGAGFTAVHVTLWMYRVLIALSIVSAVFFAVGVMGKKIKTIVAVPVIMIVVGIVGAGATALVQNFIVSPDELNKEAPYLSRNIQYSQAAYDLQNVESQQFTATANLTSADIQNNDATISNIRINDYQPTLQFYNQTQNLRTYYTFNDVDVDRYMVNGKYTQTFLSARELDESKINNPTWFNQHLLYTHGYGIVLSRVDKITAQGQPDMLIDNIPPVSQVTEIKIARPEIYFGEMTNSYVITNSKEQEFNYPIGNDNRYSMYQGSAGIPLNPFNRLLFSIREQSLKLLVSSEITSKSRIIINRNIADRVRQIMPYLTYDSNPYVVTVGGKVYWVIDAYTESSNFPYSEPYQSEMGGSFNYIRNSVKVVIDAYNGTTDFYLVNHKDPIADTYQKIFPALFKNFDQMPAALQAHIRYPNALLDVQAQMYKKYHMNDVRVFYQKEDMWDIAHEIYGTENQEMTPNYYIMKLPGQSKAEFVNSIPYTPKGKANMAGLLVARNDGANYGKLVIYRFPKNQIVYGPMQVEAQIDQNTDISKEFSLWKGAGSTYSRGNMFVIPIENALIYVEPVYLIAENSSLPEVKRVIVFYNNQIAYQPTLTAALDELFGSNSTQNESGNGQTTNNKVALTQAQLAAKAQQAFNNAQSAQKNGDWAAYGRYLKQLQQYLDQMASGAK